LVVTEESVTELVYHLGVNVPRTTLGPEKEKEKQLPTRKKQLNNKNIVISI
jgi:hypothetical protein